MNNATFLTQTSHGLFVHAKLISSPVICFDLFNYKYKKKQNYYFVLFNWFIEIEYLKRCNNLRSKMLFLVQTGTLTEYCL